MDHEAHEEHEASPDHAVQDSDRSQPWQRFTVLDILLLPLAFALGVSLASFLFGRSADTVECVIVGGFFGHVLAGPIVLFVQYAFRRRWQRLSGGEWLWLAFQVKMLLFFMMGALGPSIPDYVVMLYLGTVVVFFSMAILVLIGQLTGMRRDVPCRWTDFLGAAVWVLPGLLICVAFAIFVMKAWR